MQRGHHPKKTQILLTSYQPIRRMQISPLQIILLAVVVFFFLSLGFLLGRWVEKRKIEKTDNSLIALSSQASGIEAWCTAYNQTSNTVLETAKFFSAANAVALAAATSIMDWFQIAAFPMVACALFSLGLLTSLTPLVDLSMKHQSSANSIANALKDGPINNVTPLPLPVLNNYKGISLEIRLPLWFLAFGISTLFVGGYGSINSDGHIKTPNKQNYSTMICTPSPEGR